jgi:hypothetical protein
MKETKGFDEEIIIHLAGVQKMYCEKMVFRERVKFLQIIVVVTDVLR